MKKAFLSIALLSSAFISAQIHLHAKIVHTKGDSSRVIAHNDVVFDTNTVKFADTTGSVTYTIANETEESVEVTVTIAKANDTTGVLEVVAEPVMVVAFDKEAVITLAKENEETEEKESLSVTVTAHNEGAEYNDDADNA